MSETSVKIIKNEIRCRDETVPKTVDTRRHCKVWLRARNNLPQPPPYISVLGFTEDCCMLSTIPCSGFLYLQCLAQCHPYILFKIFTLVQHGWLLTFLPNTTFQGSPERWPTPGVDIHVHLSTLISLPLLGL